MSREGREGLAGGSSYLQVKLAAFPEDEMQKWEKTFPDELWKEFRSLYRLEGTAASAS
jgi:hypothetical protein